MVRRIQRFVESAMEDCAYVALEAKGERLSLDFNVELSAIAISDRLSSKFTRLALIVNLDLGDNVVPC